MPNTKVLLIGATGHLGQNFVKPLRAKNKEVSILLRPETAKTTDPAKRALIDGFVKAGCKVVEGSLHDTASLDRACSGMEVVICVANGQELPLQVGLATAAKKAGVRRFFSSEFGIDANIAPKGAVALLDWKRDLQGAIRGTGVTVTNVISNLFATYWASGLGQLGLSSPPDAVQLYGSGNVKAALVTPADIAAYTVEMIDDPRTENKDVAIVPSANLLTQNELISLWESVSGKKVTRTPVPAAGLEQAIASMQGKPEKMMDLIYTQLTKSAWVDGSTSKKRPEALEATELYPQIKYTRISDFFGFFKK